MNKYLSVLLLISTLVSTHLIPQLETMPQHVATSYSHAMFGPKIHEKPKKEEKQPSAFTLPKPETRTLQDRQAQEIAFQLVAENFQTDTSNVIDISFVDKMEIVAGGENNKTHLFGTIFDPYINTAIGTAFASLSLCTPTSNVTHIKNRQAVIQLLCENEHDLYRSIKVLGNRIALGTGQKPSEIAYILFSLSVNSRTGVLVFSILKYLPKYER